MICPTCEGPLRQAGRTYKCEACDGAWVQRDVLVPLLEQRAAALVELPWRPGHEDHVRPCPECTAAMQSAELGTVALDRCEPHGVWFDARELAALLKQVRKFRADSQSDADDGEHARKGLLRRLADLFG
jgi:Zn-finger nucleic acid-binding protein